MTGRARQRLMRPVERQPMKDWLTDKLNGKEIPGLEWVNEENKIFRIKWCHGSRHGWSIKDSILFEKWAQHSGRYNEGDPKRWKANFRCALNSLKDVQEVKDLSISKGQNAFRVYRMLEARRKTEKTKFTKRVKVEPEIRYIPEDTKCILKDTMSVRSSARLASQTVAIKPQADDKFESSESESEGYQTDVQEDQFMDTAVKETSLYMSDAETCAAVTQIKTENTETTSRIPNFHKFIPNFDKLEAELNPSRPYLEFGKDHLLPRHGSGFKVIQLQEQKPLTPIIEAFQVPPPGRTMKSLHSLNTNHQKCVSSNADLTFISDQELSSRSLSKQTTMPSRTPVFYTPTTEAHCLQVQASLVGSNGRLTFPDTPDASDVSNDSNSNEYIEVTIYEEEVSDSVSGESTDGCIVLTDLSNSYVSSASLTSQVHSFEDNKVTANNRAMQTDVSTVPYSYTPLTPP